MSQEDIETALRNDAERAIAAYLLAADRFMEAFHPYLSGAAAASDEERFEAATGERRAAVQALANAVKRLSDYIAGGVLPEDRG